MPSFSRRVPRWLRTILLVIVCLLAAVLLTAASAWMYFNPSVDRTDGVVYSQRRGTNLTMDIIRPRHPNGLAIALMVSGGWRSKKAGETPVWLMAPVLRAGYTVFAICHISQPGETVTEIMQDMHRGIRFVRYHAKEYGIDPNRIGVTGGSAGGHLGLILATRGGPGDPNAPDPIDRESSAVQAAALFYPVTDLLNLGPSTEYTGPGRPPKSFIKAFGVEHATLDEWTVIGRDASPIYFITKNMAPTLIYHGDADTLVPLEQSQRFRAKAAELGIDVPLVVHPGGRHGWPTMLFDEFHFIRWFDEHLKAPKS